MGSREGSNSVAVLILPVSIRRGSLQAGSLLVRCLTNCQPMAAWWRRFCALGKRAGQLFQALGLRVWLIRIGNRRVSGTLLRKMPMLEDHCSSEAAAPDIKAGSGSSLPLGKIITA